MGEIPSLGRSRYSRNAHYSCVTYGNLGEFL